VSLPSTPASPALLPCFPSHTRTACAPTAISLRFLHLLPNNTPSLCFPTHMHEVVAGGGTLQHVQHPDLLLKHPNKTLASYV
jgi:hypothetical protein